MEMTMIKDVIRSIYVPVISSSSSSSSSSRVRIRVHGNDDDKGCNS